MRQTEALASVIVFFCGESKIFLEVERKALAAMLTQHGIMFNDNVNQAVA